MMTSRYVLHLGDCIEVMRGMDDGTVDAIVTDPPYELGFMGKSWDASGIANNVEMWREALRVLKPGGHLLAFSGSRTYHRMTCAIEDAGFEIRDQVMWVYGSGFPKSLDVSKAIDKTGGQSVAWFGPWLKRWREERGLSQRELCERCGLYGKVNRGGTIANWELGLGQPTVEQFNRICEVLNLPFDNMESAEREVIAQQRQAKLAVAPGQGEDRSAIVLDVTAPATDAARQWSGWGTALKPAHEPICVARKPLAKGCTIAANVLQFGTGAINIDGCRVPTNGEQPRGSGDRDSYRVLEGRADLLPQHSGNVTPESGRWPANLIHDGSDEVVALFPAEAGAFAPVRGTEPSSATKAVFGQINRRASNAFHADRGSAARFFYCAKASRADRNEGMPSGDAPAVANCATMRAREDADWSARNGNHHPTVKPTDLMAYLVRLVTAPGGLVLDPFMGSGSTGKACIREGFQFVGIDMTPEYVEIARARIEHELVRVEGPAIAIEAKSPVPATKERSQGDLFGDAA